MNMRRFPLSVVRLAAGATVAVGLTIGAAAALNMVAADDTRVMGRLVLPFGSGDWGFAVRAETDAQERWTGESKATPQPRVDLTAWFSGSKGRFESLSLNGMPVISAEPVLYVDRTEGMDSGVGWVYVTLGVAGAGLVLWAIADAFSDDLTDAIDKEIDDYLDSP